MGDGRVGRVPLAFAELRDGEQAVASCMRCWPPGPRAVIVRIRPVDGESGACLAVLADSHSREVLEDCRGRGSSAAGEIERRLLPPQPPRDGAWWRVAKAPYSSQEVAQKQLLLYGPYVSLPAGRYRAVFAGLAVRSGAVRMAVTSEEGRTHHATTKVDSASGPALIDFTLQRASQDVEVTLRAEANSQLRMPSSLVIYSAAPVGSSPWSALKAGR